MKLQTREQIDNHFRELGVDVDKLNKEFKEMGKKLDKEEFRAIEFLKRRMGHFHFFLWKMSCIPNGPRRNVGFEYNGYIEKAKEYGFKSKF